MTNEEREYYKVAHTIINNAIDKWLEGVCVAHDITDGNLVIDRVQYDFDELVSVETETAFKELDISNEHDQQEIRQWVQLERPTDYDLDQLALEKYGD